MTDNFVRATEKESVKSWHRKMDRKVDSIISKMHRNADPTYYTMSIAHKKLYLESMRKVEDPQTVDVYVNGELFPEDADLTTESGATAALKAFYNYTRENDL